MDEEVTTTTTTSTRDMASGDMSAPRSSGAYIARTVPEGAETCVPNGSRMIKKTLRLQQLEDALESPVASQSVLQELLWLGVPLGASPSLRGRIWKILLGFTSLAKANREYTAGQRIESYRELRDTHFNPNGVEAATVLDDDFLPPESVRDFGQHEKSYRQVKADVKRTSLQDFRPVFQNSAIRACMTRVLLLWDIRNPASGYVQGFNDLLSPFVVVFAQDLCDSETLTEQTVSQLSADQLLRMEAECHWCFSKLVSNVQDVFIFGQPGVVRMIEDVEKIIRRVDCSLLEHLHEAEVDLLQVCFRWMSCFLVREFPAPLVLRLWDTYIAEGQGGFSDFHVYVCSALLICWSTQLKQLDFQQIYLFMQSLPTSTWTAADLESLLAEAFILKSLFRSSPKHLLSCNSQHSSPSPTAPTD